MKVISLNSRPINRLNVWKRMIQKRCANKWYVYEICKYLRIGNMAALKSFLRPFPPCVELAIEEGYIEYSDMRKKRKVYEYDKSSV